MTLRHFTALFSAFPLLLKLSRHLQEVFQTEGGARPGHECVTNILGFNGLGHLCHSIQAFPDDGQNLSVDLGERFQRLAHPLYPLLLHRLDLLLTTHTHTHRGKELQSVFLSRELQDQELHHANCIQHFGACSRC